MFTDFPEFTPLNLELGEVYNKKVAPYTPYSDISFPTLQIWWNLNGKLAVSILNTNLIIQYEVPFDEKNSGLCIIGIEDLDETIATIFSYLKRNAKKVRLVHVPEFVVEAIKRPDNFIIKEEPDYNEYLLDSSSLAKLEGHEYQLLRKKIKRFLRTAGEEKVSLKELDLTNEDDQNWIFKSVLEWEHTGDHNNDPDKTEHAALQKTLNNASLLSIKNLALFVENKLYGIVLFHKPPGKNTYILHHMKLNYELPYISDFFHHEIAKRATRDNVETMNIEMDLGIENLRKHKMTLRPASLLKKYTIRPK